MVEQLPFKQLVPGSSPGEGTIIMKFTRKKFNLLTLLLVFFIAFQIGSLRGSMQCKVCSPEDIDFSLFWEAYDKLKSNFVNKDLIDDQELIYGSIKGLTDSLGDPYTVFLTPQQTKTFLEDVDGSFEGVGMEIGIRNNKLKVIAPLEGTPAKEAGLRPGDIIVQIDGSLTVDITIEEAVNLIRGVKGTEVVLTVYREGWEDTQDFSITRDVIEIPSLAWESVDDNIAYIQIYHFSKTAAHDFRNAALEIIDSPADRIILDVRGNPGGYLEISKEIASWFLEKEDVILIEKKRNGDLEEYRAHGNSLLKDYELVVLIDQGSASASEIVAGALKDNRDVLLIGQKSFGKGSVQQLEGLTGGSSLKVTIAEWLTPSGQLITDLGLEPDIEVEYTEEDFLNDEDSQLDRAIEEIKKL